MDLCRLYVVRGEPKEVFTQTFTEWSWQNLREVDKHHTPNEETWKLKLPAWYLKSHKRFTYSVWPSESSSLKLYWYVIFMQQMFMANSVLCLFCILNQDNKEERWNLPVNLSTMFDRFVQDGTSCQTGGNCDCCSHSKQVHFNNSYEFSISVLLKWCQ